jgi:hypothetical protein
MFLQAPHIHKNLETIIVLCASIFSFLDSRLENRSYWT